MFLFQLAARPGSDQETMRKYMNVVRTFRPGNYGQQSVPRTTAESGTTALLQYWGYGENISDGGSCDGFGRSFQKSTEG